MSTERIERVRAILPADGTDLVEAFGGSEPIPDGGLVTEDASVKMTARSAEREGVGPDAFRASWTDWLEPWQTYLIYNEKLVDRGDRVVALVRLRGVTRRDGVEMEHEAAAVFRFDGDQVVELEFTLEREEALAD